MSQTGKDPKENSQVIEDLIIEKDDFIDDISTPEGIKTILSEKRKTGVSDTANRIAVALIIVYIIFLIGYFLGINSPSGPFERFETLIAVIIGFYFGKR